MVHEQRMEVMRQRKGSEFADVEEEKEQTKEEMRAQGYDDNFFMGDIYRYTVGRVLSGFKDRDKQLVEGKTFDRLADRAFGTDAAGQAAQLAEAQRYAVSGMTPEQEMKRMLEIGNERMERIAKATEAHKDHAVQSVHPRLSVPANDHGNRDTAPSR